MSSFILAKILCTLRPFTLYNEALTLFSYLNVPAFKETESVEVSLLALHHMKSFSHNKQNKNAPTSQDLRLCYACSIIIYCYMQPLLVFY